MNELTKLFDEEQEIQKLVRKISTGILDLSDYSLSKGPIELAEAEVIGKQMRKVCEDINEHVHHATKIIGALMTRTTKVKFKGRERSLHEVENELSLIHGDLEAIGNIAENFFEAPDRKAAFQNLSLHYGELLQHLTSLMLEEFGLK